ncbi:MAG: Dabb family protein [Bacteroidetes bacterium]|nr:Dabb family protein [Bacteroidota bacterium]
MVIFNLPYPKESSKAIKFIQDGTRILTEIPVVQNFQAFNQVSIKNKFQYGFSMVFANPEDYKTYNNHPDHVAFVQDRWMKEVTDFLEIDFEK